MEEKEKTVKKSVYVAMFDERNETKAKCGVGNRVKRDEKERRDCRLRIRGKTRQRKAVKMEGVKLDTRKMRRNGGGRWGGREEGGVQEGLWL